MVPFASDRSAGKQIEWNGSLIECRPLRDETIQGLDLVLSSAGGSVSAEWAPKLVEAGAVVVDNSGVADGPGLPLVVPEVNADELHHIRGSSPTPTARRSRWWSR